MVVEGAYHRLQAAVGVINRVGSRTGMIHVPSVHVTNSEFYLQAIMYTEDVRSVHQIVKCKLAQVRVL